MHEADNKTDLTTFYDILRYNEIQIPKIQRDYAQGRTNFECTKKRIDFFNYLLKKIKGDGAILDFAYGKKEEDIIELLDGQQRFTTLFLLHAYALKKAKNCLEKVKYEEAQKYLKRFSYDTRETSKRFCRDIIDEDFEIPLTSVEWNEESAKENRLPFANEIKKQKWYYGSYDYDQTVKAMIVSLEDIHNKFNDIEGAQLWIELTENKKIKFHFLNIENINQTDSIYIKMNARGKDLNVFENIKAEIEEKIIVDGPNDDDRYLEDNGFKNKIDTSWSNFLWKYYENKGESLPYKIDNSFLNLLSVCIMYNSEDKDVISSLNDNKSQHKISDYLFFKDGNLGEPRKTEQDEDDQNYTRKIFEMFCSFIELYSSNEKVFTTKPKIIFWNPEADNFADIIFRKEKTTYQQKAIFLAHTLYFLKNKEFNEEKYNDWMRVIRNIVYNRTRNSFARGLDYTIHEAKDMPSLFSLIIKLSSGASDIYNYLQNTIIMEWQGVTQYKQELVKAKFINKYRKLIFDLEDNYILQGDIDFALFCAFEDGEEIKLENVKWEDIEKINTVLNNYFTPDNFDEYNFRRAILTIPPKRGGNWRKDECCSHACIPIYAVVTRGYTGRKSPLYRDLDEILWVVCAKSKKDAYFLKQLIGKLVEGETYINIIDKCNMQKLAFWKQNIIKMTQDEWSEYTFDDGEICKVSPFILQEEKDEDRSVKYYLIDESNRHKKDITDLLQN